MGYCLLSMLTRQAIEEIWRYFPHERLRLIDIVKKRMSDDRKKNAANLWGKATNKLTVVARTMKTAGQHTPLLHAETTGSNGSCEIGQTAAAAEAKDHQAIPSLSPNLEAVPEEEEGINEAELGMMPKRTFKGDAPSSEDLKIVASRVDSTVEALLR